MAILVISNALLKDPEIWDMIDSFCDTIEIVKRDINGTVMRITNDELPKDDYLVDLVATTIPKVRPMITSFTVYEYYHV